jgi:hypothetical protein
LDVFDLIDATEFRADKFIKKNLFSSARMFLDIYCLQPGQEQIVHEHAGNDKVYFMMARLK